MNISDEVIESALRTALHDAADQIDVRLTPSTATADELVVRRRVTRRAPMVVAIAAGLVVVLAIGGALLLSAGRDPSSVQTAAGAPGGCAGKAYVVDAGDGDGDGTVFAITTATGEVSTPIPVSLSTSGGAISAVAITPDGKYAYVTGGDTVLVIDTATDTVSATIPVDALDVAITPDGRHAYVANTADGTVSVITTATGAVSAPITVGKGPTGVAICPARSAHRRR
jgi:YVTN family beta-propeller protein